MNSFINLFDPNGFNNEPGQYSNKNLPPESPAGNVEYKLKIINPSKQRFEHLVTQMKWRLGEGKGEAIYIIGIQDNGQLIGLSKEEMQDSLNILKQMAMVLGATTTVLNNTQLSDGKIAAEILICKILEDQDNIDIRIAVMGSADAGKSTLLGVLTQGNLDNGHGKARLNMFRHLHEVQTGRTSSIAHEILGFDQTGKVINYSSRDLMTTEEIFMNSTKLVTFLDLAGHKKYLRTTILGLSGYFPHCAMLVISGTSGVMGMTHEHLYIANALDIPFFVVITKIDLVSPEDTYNSIKTILENEGIQRLPIIMEKEEDILSASTSLVDIVPIFFLSNVTGVGLELLKKFLYVFPSINLKEREQLEKEPCEFQIDETFVVSDTGQVMGGLLTHGIIHIGSPLKIGPMQDCSFQPVIIQSIHRNKVPCKSVHAGQSASVTLYGNQIDGLRRGMVLISNNQEAFGCFFFQATVLILYHVGTIYPGFQTMVYIGSVRQAAIIEGMTAEDGARMNEQSSMIFRFVSHPEYLRVGSRLLFKVRSTRGIGQITDIFPQKAFTKDTLKVLNICV